MRYQRWIHLLGIAVIGIMGGGCALGGTEPDACLPDGMAVVEKSIQAEGGRDALLKIKTRILNGTIQVDPLGIKGRFEISQARPNKVYMKIETEGLGTIERGCDGKVFWERRSNGEVRFLEGEDLDLHLLSSFFDETYSKELYRAIEVMGEQAVDGQVCYKVLFVPHRGPDLVAFYDKETGLRLRTQLSLNRAGFSTTMDAFARDYRKTDMGVMLAYTILEQSMGTETWRRLTDVQFNEEIDPNLFKAPQVTDRPITK